MTTPFAYRNLKFGDETSNTIVVTDDDVTAYINKDRAIRAEALARIEASPLHRQEEQLRRFVEIYNEID
ncbi:hypothetical protein CH278_19675 [Rhodococcus sp. 05-2254-5]|uniref:hypothetical protein n=1 Tax=unclassified Rhodococcus (in: high G+C Gram-positive bacteria) TaxID=192944 RepID=UPI000B9BFEB9|nr:MULTISPECIES: hypothetical protein [unclassified Rhodococcus (in: high G+C Gram-positive bacteria)]OZE29087.1 hypothetical protein CH278_19675 [Rhodococcus sp. 05-2254-5]OZE53779.1 hypothetical protein CH269_21950 [Rhodococcus sp. 05-2254-1]